MTETTSDSSPVSPLCKDLGICFLCSFRSHHFNLGPTEFPVPLPFQTILSNLPAIHAKLFDMLDAELDKVETFYAEREKEMHERDKQLKQQLNELGVHRKIFYVGGLFCG